jgi:hypothetical protein
MFLQILLDSDTKKSEVAYEGDIQREIVHLQRQRVGLAAQAKTQVHIFVHFQEYSTCVFQSTAPFCHHEEADGCVYQTESSPGTAWQLPGELAQSV